MAIVYMGASKVCLYDVYRKDSRAYTISGRH